MKRLFHLHYLISFLIVSGSIRAEAALIQLHVPDNLPNGQGNSEAADGPFNLIGPEKSLRWQQVYDASQFSRIAPLGGYIQYMTFHWQQPFPADMPHVQVNVSTTTRGPDGLSAVFADNIGPDEQIIFDGRFNVQIDGSVITFAQPFYYAPSQGNLLVDIRNFAGMQWNFPGIFPRSDLEETEGDSISSVVSPNNVYDLNGIAATIGIPTTFWIEPVPEPSSLLLLAGGGLTVGLACWRGNRGKRNSPPAAEPQGREISL